MSDGFADALRATLVDTWLQGHGRDNASMAEATASGWTRDLAEGLAASRAIGEQVIVTTTSKGGTSAAAAALDANPSKGVTAMVFVSLNFGVNTVAAWVSALSWVRTWLPFLSGFDWYVSRLGPEKDNYWTVVCPWEAVVSMSGLVKPVCVPDFPEPDPKVNYRYFQ